jgi:hypothetical protein
LVKMQLDRVQKEGFAGNFFSFGVVPVLKVIFCGKLKCRYSFLHIYPHGNPLVPPNIKFESEPCPSRNQWPHHLI